MPIGNAGQDWGTAQVWVWRITYCALVLQQEGSDMYWERSGGFAGLACFKGMWVWSAMGCVIACAIPLLRHPRA